ncbi:MAG: phage adaptor protein [Minisyncoccota bacterium]
MNRGAIKTAIKNEVDDQTLDDTLLNTWVQRADEKVQSWRPADDRDQTFDYWDYLKTEQPYTSVANQTKYPVPDTFRAFVELRIGTDTKPYDLIDFRERSNRKTHAVYLLGGYFYPLAIPTADGLSMSLVYVRMSDDFASDNDEPEVEKLYHQAYVEWGKKMYYNQQGDTELERQAEVNFEKFMIGKWRDQELARMTSASDQAEIPRTSIV